MPKKVMSPSLEIKKSLRQSNTKARKSMGQHFLTDTSVLDTIVSAAELSPQDTVIEVGPGLGILTAELAQKAGKVVAVEIDASLASQLKRKLSSFSNLTIVNADILEVVLSDLLNGEDRYKVVANIPYYITSPILHYFIDASPRPSLMVVMVQKEVGEAIVAEPGALSMLALSIQIYSKPKIISFVPAERFYPPPKVDSAIVRFDMLPEPAVNVADINHFLTFVRCGFRSPRKQLRNSLAQGLGMRTDEIATLLHSAIIEPQRRPETLQLSEWQRLYEVALSSGIIEPS